MSTVTLPLEWILGVIGSLAAVITTLAGVLWSIMKSRLVAQDKIIEGLQKDVERLSRGCGMAGCNWRNRL